MEDRKECTKCHKTYFLDGFWLSKSGKLGREAKCRNCLYEIGSTKVKCASCGKEITKNGLAKHGYICKFMREAESQNVSVMQLMKNYVVSGYDQQDVWVQRAIRYLQPMSNLDFEEWKMKVINSARSS